MDYTKLFDAIKRQTIVMDYEPAAKPLPADASKFGGKPYLPVGFEWPYYEGEDYNGEVANRPLAFLAQINLEEIAEFDDEHQLPHKGMLYFFYELESMLWGFDPKDKGCARVYYFEDTTGFHAHRLPADLSDYGRIPEYTLTFDGMLDLPEFDEYADYHEETTNWDEYDEERTLYGYELMDEDCTKMLGYANWIQSCDLMECELTSRGVYCGSGTLDLPEQVQKEAFENSADWVLLFQMSSICEDDHELMFGDCGMIYYFIKKQDLADLNFNNVWLIMQCC